MDSTQQLIKDHTNFWTRKTKHNFRFFVQVSNICLIQQSGSTFLLLKYRIQFKPLGFQTNQIRDQAWDWCFKDGCWCNFFFFNRMPLRLVEAVTHSLVMIPFLQTCLSVTETMFRHCWINSLSSLGGFVKLLNFAFTSLAISELGCSKG